MTKKMEVIMATKSTSLQSLGNGTYRVSGARVNPNNGQYVVREAGAVTRTSSAGQAAKTPRSGTTKKADK